MRVEISPIGDRLRAELQHKIDQKTKPVGALGRLESLALKIGLIQNTLTPSVSRPALVVCAADHGAATAVEGISAYPPAVTAQMVLNFLAGGAAINVFAEANDIDLHIVDCGVDHEFTPGAALIDAKIARGTRNYVVEPAMSPEQCATALANGAQIVSDLHQRGCNTVAFGEMGIGNSASAALLMSLLLDLPLSRCAGAGAGLDAAGVERKTAILERARQRIAASTNDDPTALRLLAEAGGFEIATLCGAMLRAAELRMLILVDGFIVGAAALLARALAPNVTGYFVFSHQSAEAGHRLMLDRLDAEPLLHLDLRLGEGTGAALALPLMRSAVAFLNRMASFEAAGVSGKRDG